MLNFVAQRYEAVLSNTHLTFVSDFFAMPVPAQCLYVRLAGRKGRIFNIEKFSYDEIPYLAKQADILKRFGFITNVTESIYGAFLSSLSKAELIAFMTRHICNSAYRVSWKKSALVDTALAHIPFTEDIIDREYILQSLGLVRTPDFKADYGARFDTLEEAKAAYFYAKGVYDFKHGSDKHVAQLIDNIEDWPSPQCMVSIHGRDKLLEKLGRRDVMNVLFGCVTGKATKTGLNGACLSSLKTLAVMRNITLREIFTPANLRKNVRV